MEATSKCARRRDRVPGRSRRGRGSMLCPGSLAMPDAGEAGAALETPDAYARPTLTPQERGRSESEPAFWLGLVLRTRPARVHSRAPTRRVGFSRVPGRSI